LITFPVAEERIFAISAPDNWVHLYSGGTDWPSLRSASYVDERRKLNNPLSYDPDRSRGGKPGNPQFKKVAERTDLVACLGQSVTAPDWLADATKQAFAGGLADEQFLTYLDRVLREDPVSIAFAMNGISARRRTHLAHVEQGKQEQHLDGTRHRDNAAAVL